jgi:uncharacterized protein YgiM (DUF1202 family)
MTRSFEPGQTVKTTADYQPAYPDPLVVKAGEVVMVGREDTEWVGWVWCTNVTGKGGWVPKVYFELVGEGGRGKMLVDYTAAELLVKAGETITLHYEESGWYWATNAAGQSGWVPKTSLVET